MFLTKDRLISPPETPYPLSVQGYGMGSSVQDSFRAPRRLKANIHPNDTASVTDSQALKDRSLLGLAFTAARAAISCCTPHHNTPPGTPSPSGPSSWSSTPRSSSGFSSSGPSAWDPGLHSTSPSVSRSRDPSTSPPKIATGTLRIQEGLIRNRQIPKCPAVHGKGKAKAFSSSSSSSSSSGSTSPTWGFPPGAGPSGVTNH
ncbi:unnamed protein product [Sympodiomycopsis kandeliae]